MKRKRKSGSPTWLAVELRRRDVGQREIAEAAGVGLGVVYRLVHGLSDGSPASRRKLRAALLQYPVVEELDISSPVVEESEPASEPEPPRRSGSELLAEIRATQRDPWGPVGGD